MSSSSQGRVIIGLCMDKERDEELLNFLSSKKNKSEFIRNILYKNLENLKNGDTTSSSDSNFLLSDISITLRNILFVLTNSNTLKSSFNSQSCTSTSMDNTPCSESECLKDELDDIIQDEDDLILGAVADSIKGF